METSPSVSVPVGIIGASSLVGQFALALLNGASQNVIAFTRKPAPPDGERESGWRCLYESTAKSGGTPIPYWICFAPIWALPEHFPLLEVSGVRRVVAISSTSRFTKQSGRAASSPQENALALRLADAEAQFETWANLRGVEWVVLRPTMIYALGRDKNISEIAGLIQKLGFFPLLGEAKGLRQPIHAQDVAAASIECLLALNIVGQAYNISGGETLTYRDMVTRVFVAMGRRPRFITVPLPAFRAAIACAQLLPRYRSWSSAMAERMNQDMVFEHADAARDFGFAPRVLELGPMTEP